MQRQSVTMSEAVGRFGVKTNVRELLEAIPGRHSIRVLVADDGRDAHVRPAVAGDSAVIFNRALVHVALEPATARVWGERYPDFLRVRAYNGATSGVQVPMAKLGSNTVCSVMSQLFDLAMYHRENGRQSAADRAALRRRGRADLCTVHNLERALNGVCDEC